MHSQQPFQSFRHALAPTLIIAFACLHSICMPSQWPWTGSCVLGSEGSVCRCCSAHVVLLGLTAVRLYGRFQSMASCSEESSSALMARCTRDRGRLCPRRKRRINPRSYFDVDPGQRSMISTTSCCQVLRAAWEPYAKEGLYSVLIFMSRFWQQFTNGAILSKHSGLRVDLRHESFLPETNFADCANHVGNLGSK